MIASNALPELQAVSTNSRWLTSRSGVEQKFGHADDAVHRRAYLVTMLARKSDLSSDASIASSSCPRIDQIGSRDIGKGLGGRQIIATQWSWRVSIQIQGPKPLVALSQRKSENCCQPGFERSVDRIS